MPTSPPIFIVGSPRSGTTLLRLILDSHSHIACGPETHILGEWDDGLVRHWKRLERYGFDQAYWDSGYRRMFEHVKQDYCAAKGKRRWADKTPSYALHLPFIGRLFPDAQIVHVIRDVRMVTASVLDRWGRDAALAAPVRWAESVTRAREAGAAMEAGRYREIRFEHLIANVEGTLRELFDWLGEPWEPDVLDYDRFPHDESNRNQTVRAAARDSQGRAIDGAPAASPRRSLDPLLRVRVERAAGRLNRELGYT